MKLFRYRKLRVPNYNRLPKSITDRLLWELIVAKLTKEVFHILCVFTAPLPLVPLLSQINPIIERVHVAVTLYGGNVEVIVSNVSRNIGDSEWRL
jgi:uncharacterized membrane protein